MKNNFLLAWCCQNGEMVRFNLKNWKCLFHCHIDFSFRIHFYHWPVSYLDAEQKFAVRFFLLCFALVYFCLNANVDTCLLNISLMALVHTTESNRYSVNFDEYKQNKKKLFFLNNLDKQNLKIKF